jgi:hypothetical protein
MPLEPACDLAKRFHQDAFYYVEGDDNDDLKKGG